MRLPFELRGGLLLAANTFLTLILAFPVQVLVARYLGPERQGVYAFVLSFANLARVFVSVSLPDVLVPLYKREKEDSVFGSAWLLRQGAALLLTSLVALWTLAQWRMGRAADVQLGGLILLAVMAYHFSDYELFTTWCKCEGRLGTFVWIDFAGTVVGLLLRLWLVFNGGSLWALVLSYLWEQVARLALALIAYFGAGRPFLKPICCSPRRAWQLLQQAWPLWVSALLGVAASRIDQILLGSLLPDASELGQFSVASRIVEALSAGSVALFIVYLPLLSSHDDEGYQQQMQRHHDLSVLACAGLMAPMVLLLTPLITTVYGASYVKAAHLSLLYLGILPVLYLSLCRSAFLFTQGLQKVELILKILSLLAGTALNLYLIPRYGAEGAVLTALTLQWILLLLPYLLLRSLRPAALALLRSLYLPGNLRRGYAWLRSRDKYS